MRPTRNIETRNQKLFGSIPILFAVVIVAGRYPENPPPAHTGGFGEPTCLECHFDGELNPPGGHLYLNGVGSAVKPGTANRLEVLLEKEDMERAGFQLSARFPDGRQAGELNSMDECVKVDTTGGIQYVRQTMAGTELQSKGTTRWSFEWHAPVDTAGIVFHLSANAANGDASAFGDAIYGIECRLSSDECRVSIGE